MKNSLKHQSCYTIYPCRFSNESYKSSEQLKLFSSLTVPEWIFNIFFYGGLLSFQVFISSGPKHHRGTWHSTESKYCYSKNIDFEFTPLEQTFLFLFENFALEAGVNVKAVLRSLNTAFLPISRSRFKRH